MFEEGRAAWLSARFDTPYPTYVVARQEIDFEREIRLPDGPVTLNIELVRLGTKSLQVAETIESRDGRIHARSRAVLVMWNPDARTSRALTDSERASLEHPSA
jgi:acyl-CoA thioester hydrolase